MTQQEVVRAIARQMKQSISQSVPFADRKRRAASSHQFDADAAGQVFRSSSRLSWWTIRRGFAKAPDQAECASKKISSDLWLISGAERFMRDREVSRYCC